MDRPGFRPLTQVRELESRKTELETCAYCPKLCRGACPVSEASPNESLTPWGKMSGQYFLARGDTSDASVTANAFACTGCFGCREQCDHRNDVAGTLLDARAGAFAKELSPPSVMRVVAKFEENERVIRAFAESMNRSVGTASGKRVALVVTASAIKHSPRAIEVGVKLLRRRYQTTVLPVSSGVSLYYAGAREVLDEHLLTFAKEMGAIDEAVFLEPGCAYLHARVLAAPPKEQETKANPSWKSRSIVEYAFEELRNLRAIENAPRVRYHDACQLGRGLGLYAEPRAVLTKLSGAAPLEFPRHHEHARCSGAGGLLPITFPEVSREMASRRLAEPLEFLDEEKATVITACPSSLRSFRKVGEAEDFLEWVGRGLVP
ncbi:MAG: (Fe-S)-binding protein [Polyangiaceae bacterium]|nr:(Fe-S)-binding protein [Polyangiaceae bacterium]